MRVALAEGVKKVGQAASKNEVTAEPVARRRLVSSALCAAA
jgi:hypothetical protein